MARTVRAGKQKPKAKSKGQARKAARRRAIAIRVEAPVLKRRAAGGARLNEKETHEAREAVTQAADAPVADRRQPEQRQQIQHLPNRTDVYGHSMETAVQATQWLLALPFLALQMWEAALLRPFKR